MLQPKYILAGLLVCGAAVFAVAVGRSSPPGLLIFSGIKAPRAVAADGERIYVIDGTGYLFIYHRDGAEISRVRLVKTARGFPAGVAVEPEGTLLVADSHEYRILRLTRDGQRLDAFGSGPGSGPGEFIYPQRFALMNGEIFVSEYGFGPNNRVQVFSPDGTFLRTFGNYGVEGGAFSRPCGIVATPQGELLVADATHRILRWSLEGEYRGDFGGEGKAPGQITYPFGMTLAEGKLIVVEYGNHRLSRFTTQGEFAGCFTGLDTKAGGFRHPRDVACDGDYLYVADTGNDRVVRIELADLPWEIAP